MNSASCNCEKCWVVTHPLNKYFYCEEVEGTQKRTRVESQDSAVRKLGGNEWRSLYRKGYRCRKLYRVTHMTGPEERAYRRYVTIRNYEDNT